MPILHAPLLAKSSGLPLRCEAEALEIERKTLGYSLFAIPCGIEGSVLSVMSLRLWPALVQDRL